MDFRQKRKARYTVMIAKSDLSPFQKHCIQRSDNRLILQPRQGGSTQMQVHLALERAAKGDRVLVLLSEEATVDEFSVTPKNVTPVYIGTGTKDVRGLNANVVIVDQPQHVPAETFEEVYGPLTYTRGRVEFVLAGTGTNFRTEPDGATAVDVAMESNFSLLFAGQSEHKTSRPVTRSAPTQAARHPTSYKSMFN